MGKVMIFGYYLQVDRMNESQEKSQGNLTFSQGQGKVRELECVGTMTMMRLKN